MSKANILIVEDEHIVAMDIRNWLENNGYQVTGHTDRGESAVQLAGDRHPDLVLIDISPKGELDGIQAAIQIRERFNIPVIFLTAFENASILEHARLAEPFGYLLKPIEERDLVTTVDMALYKHSMEQKLRESENKFHHVVEKASDGIALMDSEGYVIEWNLSMEQITDLERAAVINRPIWEIVFQILPSEKRTIETKELVTNQWKAEVKNGYANKDHMVEYEIESLKGTRRTVQSNSFIVETAQGTLGGVIMRDITEAKQSESELRKLSQAVEQSANTILLTDVEGNIEFANSKFTDVSGYSLSEVIGKTPRILNSGEHPVEFYQHLWQTIKSGDTWHGEFHNKRKDGSLYWEAATIAPVYNKHGSIINFIAIQEDITARKMLEESERDQRQLAQALLDTAMILNSTLKLDDVLDRILANIGNLVQYDAAMVSLIEGEAVRKIRYQNNPRSTHNQLPIGDMQANLLNIPILKTIVKTKQPYLISDIQKDTRWQAIAIAGMHRIRSVICVPVEIHGDVLGIINIISASPDFFSPLHTDRVLAFASQAAVAIENAKLYEEAKRLSIMDSLTELFNMRYFLDFSNLEFERVQRYTRTLSVAMVDIDHFKSINDTHGHSTGDIVLRETAQIIKHSVRSVDVVARYGGEEFVILMPETNLDDALQVAERVREIVANNLIKTNTNEISITISAGVAEKDNSTKNLEDLIRLADKALYKAKANGRNRVEAFDQNI